MSKIIPFTHLHRHDGFSPYDGQGTPEQAAIYAKSLGMKYLSVTNHGTMSGNEQHHYHCQQQGIIPIQGCEIYYMNEFQPGKDHVQYRRHMTLLARNLNGYRNLCKIMTEANINNFYIKPIADYKLLSKYADDIICLSGCVLGEIPQQIINNNFDEACRRTEDFIKIYGNRFFFEVQPQNFDDQKKANEGLIKLSQKFNRPAVMTNDSHYVNPNDLDTYMLFRKMGPIEMDEEKTNEVREQYRELYVADAATMCDRWNSLMHTDGTSYVLQSQTIAETCQPYSLVFKEEVPEHVEMDDNGNKIPVANVIARRTKRGLQALGLYDKPEYVARAKKELKVILAKPGKADYFLLTADMVDFARKNNVPVGPGRGSGVASLVAYALGIIQIDPIKFDLLFERFMHEERETLPDFDIDFSSKKYHIVLDYLTKKLHGHVAQICNVLYYKGDNLINDLSKALELSSEETENFKNIVGKMGYKDHQPDIKEMLKNKNLMQLELKYKLVSHFAKIYGNPKAFGQHASGVAVTQYAMDDYMALFVRGKETDRRINTAYDKESLTRMNVVKVDVLKIKELDIVYGCCKKIGINPKDIPLDDKDTYRSYNILNLKGIFQFDSPGGYKVIDKVKPQNIFEIMDATSLNRPGALSMDQISLYVNGKVNKNKTATSILSKFCTQTHGALVYQEQVMMVCRELAGMTWGQSSKVIKIDYELPNDHPLKVAFVQGCIDNKDIDMSIEASVRLFNNLTSYTFNRGHAAAYSVLSYWGMWLKVHHPSIFFLELLRENLGNKKIFELEADAVANQLPIFLAHVNGESNYAMFQPFKNDPSLSIRQGYEGIDNVGAVAARAIEMEWRKNGDYSNEDEFCKRVNESTGRKTITSRVLDALKNNGALEMDFDLYKQRTIDFNSYLVGRKLVKNGRYVK